MTRFVNGPSSATRLVKGKKIVYVFSDPIYHEEILTQCSELGAEDIHAMLFKDAIKTGKTYDFFYVFSNLSNTDNILEEPEPRSNYYAEILKLLKKLQLAKNKELLGDSRIHLINPVSIIGKFLPYFVSALPYTQDKFPVNAIPMFQRDLTYATKELGILRKLLDNPKAKIDKSPDERSITYVEDISKHIGKLGSAKNKDVKSKLESELESIKTDIDKAIDTFKNANENVAKLNGNGLYEKLEPIEMSLWQVFRKTSTMRILRRILDKDYVNTSVVYAQPGVCAILILWLVDAGFEVTHTTLKSYDKYQTMVDQMDGLQCIDMSDFPDQL